MVWVCRLNVTVNYVSDGFLFYSVLCGHMAFVKNLDLLFVFLVVLLVGDFLVYGGLDCSLDVTVLRTLPER